MAHLILELLELALLVWLVVKTAFISQPPRAEAPAEKYEDAAGDITDSVINLMSYSVDVKPGEEDDV